MTQLNLTRGDTGKYSFQRLDLNGNPITVLPHAIYVTFKMNYRTPTFLFQKKFVQGQMGNNLTYNNSTQKWEFTIFPEDTNNLHYGTYYYDIEVVENNVMTATGDFANKCTIAKDKLNITPESTWASNEGV